MQEAKAVERRVRSAQDAPIFVVAFRLEWRIEGLGEEQAHNAAEQRRLDRRIVRLKLR